MSSRRALHFVFKVGNRLDTANFYRNVLGMKFLRHEEFEEGCLASCNGPYDGRWSKSMVGYGPEDKHFVVELTYNYGIGSYASGNDFQGITIKSSEAARRVSALSSCQQNGKVYTVRDPNGYTFHVIDEDNVKSDPVSKCSLSSTDLVKSYEYWVDLLGMSCYERTDRYLLLGYDNENQCLLELVKIEDEIKHAKAAGRIAFSTDRNELAVIEQLMKDKDQPILTPLVSLDTPGKATVEVVILADPDGHEICFVGDAAFRQLSEVDPNANELLDKALKDDKSDEWYAKKGKTKEKV